MCSVHQVDPGYIAESLAEDYILVGPGSTDISRIDIGKRRILEYPSPRYDHLFRAYVSGTCFARGNRVKDDEGPIWIPPDR